MLLILNQASNEIRDFIFFHVLWIRLQSSHSQSCGLIVSSHVKIPAAALCIFEFFPKLKNILQALSLREDGGKVSVFS